MIKFVLGATAGMIIVGGVLMVVFTTLILMAL